MIDSNIHFINNIGRVLSQDYSFIFEALEQLAEGTCCSHGDDQICTWDLLPRVNEALHEHIAFEEKWLFPQLMPRELMVHKKEHSRLLEMLASASFELECGFGDSFRDYVKELCLALRQHHEKEAFISTIKTFGDCDHDANLLRINHRNQSPWSA